ncbi:MAG: HEPN domain-containing protein [Nanoarchaeota archaeon]
MNQFIKKLIIENKIKLVEPSLEICESYLDKSSKSLTSSKTLYKIGNFDDATALTYYSMYYSLLALLFKCGIKSQNHTGSIILLKELFDFENKEIKESKKERLDKQYYIDFKSTKEDVKIGIDIAEKFNIKILEKIDLIRIEEINNIRNNFIKRYLMKEN